MSTADRQLVVVAHNIRSLWNVGSFFRTCDAFGVSHLHLCGYTAVPPRKEIHKTALGAEEWVPWSYDADPLLVLRRRKSEGFAIVGLEITAGSVPLSAYVPTGPQCLVLGHEILGVPKEILGLCDTVVHIPMNGRKESLNVSVAAGIAMYGLQKPRN